MTPYEWHVGDTVSLLSEGGLINIWLVLGGPEPGKWGDEWPCLVTTVVRGHLSDVYTNRTYFGKEVWKGRRWCPHEP